MECLDELSRQESESPRAGRKRSASPSGRGSHRDVRAHSRATPPGMIRGELTGTLYADPRASDRFPCKASSSAGRSRQDDVPTLRSPDKSAAPSGSSRSKDQSLGVSQRQNSSPPCRVVSRSTPPRTFGEYKRSRRSGSRSPQRSSSRRGRQCSHRSRARPQCSETFDSKSRGRSDAGRSRREPSAYDRPHEPHGVDRRSARMSPLSFPSWSLST